MPDAWDRLLPRLRELSDLSSAIKLMEYDQAVFMPAGGTRHRARALATVEAIAHDKLIDPEIGALLDDLLARDDLTLEQAASVRVLKKDYEKATKVPKELVRELAERRGLAYQAWTEARPASDFSILEPHLRKMIALKKEEADAIGWAGERYDALLDTYEPEMLSSEVEEMFHDLVDCLFPLAERILDAAGERPAFVTASCDTAKQQAFSNWLVGVLGFDAQRGRLDTSPHPFTMQVGAGDVRQTTRMAEDALFLSVYATMHETGHALYEQGLPESLADLPIGHAPSLGMHESQSRLWENQVGRSRPFSDFLLPHLKELFPEQLGMATPEEFHRGVNYPKRTPIRVSADEVTYNLHVALRFELELSLFRDQLEVADLPDAWDAGMEKHVGIRPENQAEGVLQDMHRSIGAFGYFPTYTLGTPYAAASFAKVESELGPVDDELRHGDCTRLLAWLRENIHQYGYIYPAKELAQRVLGEKLTPHPFCDYLERKYSNMYGVSLADDR